jgi:hypothetical protein
MLFEYCWIDILVTRTTVIRRGHPGSHAAAAQGFEQPTQQVWGCDVPFGVIAHCVCIAATQLAATAVWANLGHALTFAW